MTQEKELLGWHFEFLLIKFICLKLMWRQICHCESRIKLLCLLWNLKLSNWIFKFVFKHWRRIKDVNFSDVEDLSCILTTDIEFYHVSWGNCYNIDETVISKNKFNWKCPPSISNLCKSLCKHSNSKFYSCPQGVYNKHLVRS